MTLLDFSFVKLASRLRRVLPQLDLTDWRILDELQADARLSQRELGRRVALSPPAVGRRVRRLEEEGVVVGYSAEIDPALVGLGLTAFVDVATHGPAASARLIEAVADMPEVIECHRLTGHRSYLLKVVAASTAELERLIDALMTFGKPVTSVVLSSPIRRRPVRREALEAGTSAGARAVPRAERMGAGGFEPP